MLAATLLPPPPPPAPRAALRHQDRWAGIVLHSAALDVVWTLTLRMQSVVGNLLSFAVPHAQLVPAVNPADLHPDPKVVRSQGGRGGGDAPSR